MGDNQDLWPSPWKGVVRKVGRRELLWRKARCTFAQAEVLFVRCTGGDVSRCSGFQVGLSV